MSAPVEKSKNKFVVVGGPALPHSTNEFYGYRAEDIAEWCAVNLSTAIAYKEGKKKPSRQSLKLFRLHADERVLEPRYWPEGWRLRRNVIADPDGNQTNQLQLAAYSAIYQLAYQVVYETGDPKIVSLFEGLLKAAVVGSGVSHSKERGSEKPLISPRVKVPSVA